jgi:hypothetical protein
VQRGHTGFGQVLAAIRIAHRDVEPVGEYQEELVGVLVDVPDVVVEGVGNPDVASVPAVSAGVISSMNRPAAHSPTPTQDCCVGGAIVTAMASPAPRAAAVPAPQAADPVAIRACLPPEVAAVFDAEWEQVLDAAKQSKDLAGVRELLAHWRHFAYQELREPGAYFRVLATAARAQASGQAPVGSVSGEEMRARIDARIAEAGLERR